MIGAIILILYICYLISIGVVIKCFLDRNIRFGIISILVIITPILNTIYAILYSSDYSIREQIRDVFGRKKQ